MSNEHTIIPEEDDIRQLNKVLFETYGYDFSDYSLASYRRRLIRVMLNFKISTIGELRDRLVNDELLFTEFLEQITVNVTEMFRDSGFYKAMRKHVIPQLASYPTIRIWHAGCSTGEEVYSMAILLKESGLLDKSLLYATDINQDVLEKAASGSFSLQLMEQYADNYIESEGLCRLSDYYLTRHGKAVFHEYFRKRMVFSAHNLVIDRSFNEFHVIICRNVLIYFNRYLQSKVVRLFTESLSPIGYLALGTKENIDYNLVNTEFEVIDRQQKIWKKRG